MTAPGIQRTRPGYREDPLDRPGQGPGAAPSSSRLRDGHARRRARRLGGNPAWPLTAFLAGYPLWWAMGIADYAFVVFAIPMTVRLWSWHKRRTRPVRLPPGFTIWLLFLVTTVAGVAMLHLTAPGTAVSPVSNRVISFAVRSLSYGAATVLLVYAGNLTEREMPRRRLAWLLGLVAVYTVIGGLGGVLDPHFQFTAPLAYVVPHSLEQTMLNQGMLHPSLAQVQSVLGVAKGRPTAPYNFTNTWGDSLAILTPWLIVAWWSQGTRWQRRIAIGVLALSIVPVIYSLDRGLWIGLVCAGVYVAVRLAARGRLAVLGVVVGGLAIAGLAVAVTPLGTMIGQRLHHNSDNASRLSLSLIATRDAVESPVLGYGDTRHVQGSVHSIAAGPTAKCRRCGYVSVGGNGQLWLLLISSGFVGAFFYVAFFAFGVLRFWRDTTLYGLAGVLVLLLGFVFMLVYTAVGEPLCFTMLAYALLWRNDVYLRGLERGGPGQAQARLPANPRRSAVRWAQPASVPGGIRRAEA